MSFFLKGEKLLPCNLTIGYPNVPPLINLQVKNDELISNDHETSKLAQLCKIYTRYANVKWIDLRGNLASKDKILDTKLYGSPVAGEDFESISLPPLYTTSVRAVTLIPKNDRTDSDIFQTFRIFPNVWWLLIAFQLMLFFLIYFIINCKRYSNRFNLLTISTWSLVGCIFSQSFCVKLQKSPRSILFLLSVFLFFILAYFGAQFSTDLVVETKPFTIDKLDDFLDPRAEKYLPAFRKTSLFLESFEKSDSPIKQQIARKCRQIGVKECLFDEDLIPLVGLYMRYQMQPRVGIVFKVMGELLEKLTCRNNLVPQEDSLMELNIGKYSLGNELMYTPISIANDSCKSTKKRIISHVSYLVSESGIVQNVIGMITKCRTSQPMFDWRCEKVDEQIYSTKFRTLKRDKFNYLFYFYVCAILFSLLVLVGEIVSSKNIKCRLKMC